MAYSLDSTAATNISASSHVPVPQPRPAAFGLSSLPGQYSPGLFSQAFNDSSSAPGPGAFFPSSRAAAPPPQHVSPQRAVFQQQHTIHTATDVTPPTLRLAAAASGATTTTTPSYHHTQQQDATLHAVAQAAANATAAAAGAPTAALAYLRADGAAKEKLLLQAQAQVRELLPYKEEAYRLRSELPIMAERLAAKDDELRRMGLLLQQQRQDHDATLVAAKEQIRSHDASAGAQVGRCEDKLRDAVAQGIALRREAEHREALVKNAQAEELAAKRQFASEREAHDATKADVARLQQRLAAAEAKVEEAVRSAVRADTDKAAATTEVRKLEATAAEIRAENDALRRKRNEVLAEHAEGTAAREVLQARLGDLTAELEQLPRLREDVARAQAAREEATMLRHALDAMEAQAANDRSYRRTLELDREQMQLRLRSLEGDVGKLDKELHQAQCDAAERLGLRRELDERLDALEVSRHTVQALQSQVLELREAHHMAHIAHAAFSADVSSLVSALRRLAETATHTSSGDALLLLMDNGMSGSGMSAALSNTSVMSQGLVSSPAHGGTNTNSNNNNSASRDPTTTGAARALFVSLDTALREMAATLAEHRQKAITAGRQLEAERSTNSSLQQSLAATTQSLTQQQLQTHDLTQKLASVTTRLTETESALGNLTALLSDHQERLTQCLHLPAPSTSAAGSSPPTSKWDSVHRCVAQMTIDLERALRKAEDVTATLAERTTDLQKERIARKEEVQTLGEKHLRETKEASLAHQLQMKEAADTQQQLKETLARAAARHDELIRETNALQAHYQETLGILRTAQGEILSLKSLVTRKDEAIGGLTKQLDDGGKIALDLKAQVASTQAALSNAQEALQETQGKLKKESDAGAAHFDTMTLLVRAVLALRDELQRILVQRNVALQYSRTTEQALHLLALEAPSAIRKRRNMRVAALAILVFNRLCKMLQKFREEPASVVAERRRLYGRRPAIGATETALLERLKLPKLPTAVSRANFVTARLPSETETLGHVLAQFEAPGVRPGGVRSRADESGALLHALASGLSRAKTAQLGPTVYARDIAQTFTNKMQSDAVERAASFRQMDALRSETAALNATVQLKQEEADRMAAQLTVLRQQQANMVDSRVHESVVNELERTKTDLTRHVSERRRIESNLSQLQTREIDLMARHNVLQNEARSLALDMATRSVSQQSGAGGSCDLPVESLARIPHLVSMEFQGAGGATSDRSTPTLDSAAAAAAPPNHNVTAPAVPRVYAGVGGSGPPYDLGSTMPEGTRPPAFLQLFHPTSTTTAGSSSVGPRVGSPARAMDPSAFTFTPGNATTFSASGTSPLTSGRGEANGQVVRRAPSPPTRASPLTPGGFATTSANDLLRMIRTIDARINTALASQQGSGSGRPRS